MRKQSIRNAVASLAAAVISTSPLYAAGANRSETSILLYKERDRVKATEGMFNLTRQLKNDFLLNLNLTFDGLTGASPTGASPSKYPATITRPSGGGRIVTAAGQLPIDNGFSDTRFAADASLSRKVSEKVTLAGGAHLSSEHDYKSLGLNGAVSLGLNQEHTTLSFSAAMTSDNVSPMGGVPLAFADITDHPDDDNGRRLNRGGRHKTTSDIVVGLTQVVNPKTVVRFNYSLSVAEGYLTDPYKIISVVQPVDSADPGEPVQGLYENRPSQRIGNAVFGQMRRSTQFGTIDASYRFFFDSWKVRSHTASLAWRFDLKKTGAIQPSVRWYSQTRAEFSRPFLVQGEPLPEFVSADSRLAKFDALTYGLLYDVPVSPNSRLILSAEWYSQSGDPSPPESFGPLLDFKLFPDLHAVMLRIGLTHDF